MAHPWWVKGWVCRLRLQGQIPLRRFIEDVDIGSCLIIIIIIIIIIDAKGGVL